MRRTFADLELVKEGHKLLINAVTFLKRIRKHEGGPISTGLQKNRKFWKNGDLFLNTVFQLDPAMLQLR